MQVLPNPEHPSQSVGRWFRYAWNSPTATAQTFVVVAVVVAEVAVRRGSVD